jgi:hypothetical protein
MSNYMKIRPKEAMLLLADGRTNGWRDGHTDITKLIVAFRNFAKAPKTGNQVLSVRNDYATARGDTDKQATLDNGECQII